MKDVLSVLDTMRRPRLLIQAARIGAADYRRDQTLGRLFGSGRLPGSGEALVQLLDIEAELDDRRRSGDGTYSATAHVELLIAMMGEARLLRITRI